MNMRAIDGNGVYVTRQEEERNDPRLLRWHYRHCIKRYPCPQVETGRKPSLRFQHFRFGLQHGTFSVEYSVIENNFPC